MIDKEASSQCQVQLIINLLSFLLSHSTHSSPHLAQHLSAPAARAGSADDLGLARHVLLLLQDLIQGDVRGTLGLHVWLEELGAHVLRHVLHRPTQHVWHLLSNTHLCQARTTNASQGTRKASRSAHVTPLCTVCLTQAHTSGAQALIKLAFTAARTGTDAQNG